MGTFTPRTTAPLSTNKWWIHTSYGGFNSCIHVAGGSCIPNCVGYAWGRFGEILGTTPTLPRADAREWYGSTWDGYSRGNKPKLGAVMCWDKPGHEGHVCIVEAIYEDGSVQTSESAWAGTRWYSNRRYPPNYDNNSAYVFQGFIYNPAVSDSPKISNGDGSTSARPDKGESSTSESTTVSTEYLGALYEYENSRNDAILREVGYLSSSYEPSISPTKIKLSAINYTGLLADLFDIYATHTLNGKELSSTLFDTTGCTPVLSNTVVNTDNISNTGAKTVINYLLTKDLNAAAACGIAANIYHESSFRTGCIGDDGTSFGICQWHNTRGDNMKAFVGTDWVTDMSGQLDFLMAELSSGYSSVLTALKSSPNTLNGAKSCADVFVRKFERPAAVDIASVRRQETAREYWNQLVQQEV